MSAVFPSRLDYETVIKRLDAFALDPGIKKGRVLMRRDGVFPQIYSGGRAVVFPVLIDGGKFAIKCWIQALGALDERYRFISKLIQESRPPYLIDSIYRESELLFNGSRYPVLQMQWSESETLKEWINSNISNNGHLRKLASNFLDVTVDMHRLKMSHGDLQHENILVNSNCSITLVDYDSIYLPGLDHLDDEIKGLPGFQHSSRARQSKASVKSDYLSEYVIYTSLMALAIKPDLWEHVKDHNRLLFSQEDIDNPRASDVFAAIRSIKDLASLVDAFESQCLCSDLNEIAPLESIIPVANSSIPTTKEIQSQSTPEQDNAQSQPRALGRASDLRNAKGWRGRRAQASESEWSFEGLINRNNKEIETEQKSTASVSVSETNPSNDRPNTIIYTPEHTITGSLYGIDISRGLISISFEEVFLRFSCQSTDGGAGSEVLLPKSKIKGWRQVNSVIELHVSSVYSSHDIIAVSAVDSSRLGCIIEMAKALNVAGIMLNNDSMSSDSQHESGATTSPANSFGKAKNEHLQRRSQSSNKHPGIREFSYSSIQDIAYCTGRSSFEVELAADSLQATPPFSLVEADRIAGRLVGDPSIRRAYARIRSSPVSSRQSSSSNHNVAESQVVSDSPFNPGMSSASSNAEKSSGVSTNKASQQKDQYDAEPPSAQGFSYSSIQDIAYCTGRSSAEVEAAAKSAKASTPFTLIEADRIANILVGEPSIRRAHKKVRLSSDSAHTISTAKQNTGDAKAVPASQSKTAASSSSSDCFVATAIYGSPDHPELSKLRLYRDNVLRSSSIGRTFIRFYYIIGPYIAIVIKRCGLSRPLLPLMSFLVRIIAFRQ